MKRCFLNYSAYMIGKSPPSEVNKATLFVVGGLYGNRAALKIIEERARHEDAEVCFNGDFNFFNTSKDTWLDINERVLGIGGRLSIVGNVELSACDEVGFAGCGCAYPSYVGESTPRWADEIVERLHKVAQACEATYNKRLLLQPEYRVLNFGGQRIAILHGDFTNVAGWRLSLEAMPPIDERVAGLLQVPRDQMTTIEYLTKCFTDADVALTCCSHTCVAYAQCLPHSRRFIFNNGAAGIPNFAKERWGLMTRISLDARKPEDALYGGMLGPLRVDAVPIRYDHGEFTHEFTELHAENSAAWLSYWKRIQNGLSWWSIEDARQRWFTSLPYTS